MAVIVAVVVSALLIPTSLFLVDVGSFYGERRALQNGADSGALAVLGTAAKRSAAAQVQLTRAEATALAVEKTTQNRVRGAGTAAVYDSSGVLGPVPPGQVASGSAYYDCNYPAPTTRFIEVHATSTTVDGGSWPNFFGSGKTLYACARAIEGNLGGVTGGFPITMSICEWEAATGGGASYAPAPPYDPFPAPVVPDPATYEKSVEVQAGGNSTIESTDPNDPGCQRGPANQFVPGGFGWLSGAGCTAEVDPTTNTAGGGSGSSEENECRRTLDDLWSARQPVFIPVHDVASGTGGGSYHIAGYAAFVITGYDLTSAGKQRSWLTDSFPNCPGSGGSGKCISGFFTQALSPVPGPVSPGGGFGATTFTLAP